MALLLNTLTFDKQQYTYNQVKGIVPIEKLGYSQGFYGGRVSRFGKTKIDGLYLCIEGNRAEVIDIYIHDLSGLTVAQLKEVAEIKGKEVPGKATKAEIIEIIEG